MLTANLRALDGHIRVPMYLNGYALVLSSGITSVLGMLYWILAARIYEPEVIGLNSAAIATMMLLADLSLLGLVNASTRFIPLAGRTTRRFVAVAFGTVVASATVISAVFVLGAELWSPKLGAFISHPVVAAWFVIATVLWALFVLMDGVLVGLRQATWIPFENAIFAALKLAAVVGFATLFLSFGVFAAWTLPLIVILIPTNVVIFRRLIPRHIHLAEGRKGTIKPRHVAHFVAGDYVSSMISKGAVWLLPVLVLEKVGAATSGYYYLSFTIAYTLYLISSNMGMSLVAEASLDENNLAAYSYRMFLQTARLVIPAVVVLVVGAPYFLRLFGQEYADEATTLLRIMATSAIPNMVIAIYISFARVQRKMRAVNAVLATHAVLVVTLSLLLLDVYGITGVGMAWLASQTLIASILMAKHFGSVWQPRPSPFSLWHIMERGLARYPFNPLFDAALRVPPLARVLIAVGSRLRRIRRRRRCAVFAKEWVPRIVAETALQDFNDSAQTGPDGGHDWQIDRVLPTLGDVTVVRLRDLAQQAAVVLKLPRSDAAKNSLRRHARILCALNEERRLRDWRELVPQLVAEGHVGGQHYLVEELLTGDDARALLGDARAWRQMQHTCTEAITVLHRLTARRRVVDTAMLARRVDGPLNIVHALCAERWDAGRLASVIKRLQAGLYEALQGRVVTVSRVHGDFVPDNILTTADGARVTGVVDWELASDDGLPQLDIVQFLLASRSLSEGREWGDVVVSLLHEQRWDEDETAVLARMESNLPDEPLNHGALVLLTWLHHVAANVMKSSVYGEHRLWQINNIDRVLHAVEEGAGLEIA